MDFDYIPRCVPGVGCLEDDWTDELAGCQCDGECTAAKQCSCLLDGQDNFDSSTRRLLTRTSAAPLLECHSLCSCSTRDKPCENRCLQLGINVKLQVFRCGDADKGYGIRAKQNIASGTFICEYAGEILGKEEVERRAGEKEHTHNYTLTVKEATEDGVTHTYIDPRIRGNLARYLNHSCEPNLELVIIRTGTIVPAVGLFAARDIADGEELCYDYGPSALPSTSSDSEEGIRRKPCRCGAEGCRGYLPMSATASE